MPGSYSDPMKAFLFACLNRFESFHSLETEKNLDYYSTVSIVNHAYKKSLVARVTQKNQTGVRSRFYHGPSCPTNSTKSLSLSEPASSVTRDAQQQRVGELTTEQRRQKGRLGGETGWVSTHSCGQLSVKDVTGGISQKPSPPLQVTAIRIQDTEDAWGLEQVFSPTSRQQQEQTFKKKGISPEYVVVLLPMYHSVNKVQKEQEL